MNNNEIIKQLLLLKHEFESKAKELFIKKGLYNSKIDENLVFLEGEWVGFSDERIKCKLDSLLKEKTEKAFNNDLEKMINE